MDLGATSLIKILQLVGGFGGVMLVVWIITLQFLRGVLKSYQDQNRQMLDTISDQHKADFEFLNQQHKEDFAVLEKFARAIEYSGGELTRLNGKIENNQFCPEVRKNTKPQ